MFPNTPSFSIIIFHEPYHGPSIIDESFKSTELVYNNKVLPGIMVLCHVFLCYDQYSQSPKSQPFFVDYTQFHFQEEWVRGESKDLSFPSPAFSSVIEGTVVVTPDGVGVRDSDLQSRPDLSVRVSVCRTPGQSGQGNPVSIPQFDPDEHHPVPFPRTPALLRNSTVTMTSIVLSSRRTTNTPILEPETSV